ncbi:hypothetical protein [Aquibacillus salsiterrae]|uniref:Uncharacterized protein n=1 Tax=Aquibacillus salsiterrae TaxID=2950439 RepID=A0A9X3WG59_9BACI|nr:hypothetical protein [Aquibacillus salsiterrae]MDC3418408.1 hypothetical protein [Aquibacillus salsiterrae]
MGNLLLFSLIISLAVAVILVPFSKIDGKDAGLQRLAALLMTMLVVIIIVVFYYLSNLDRNFSSLWFFAILVTATGAFFSFGKEQIVKAFLFVASLILGCYFILAPLFNAEEKYQLSQMNEKVEIEVFDEDVTPASVPPQFARNKMRKAFGQVPNTSYYELGSLQIQKVNGAYVYVAPVEFSGLFKWWKGNMTPGYFRLSATDSSANPTFIEAEMMYTPSSYFQKNIYRHIRNQYPQRIFKGSAQLEIDENGNPYYIRTYGEFISARNGFEPSGIVSVNPKTGETLSYTLEEAPAFIDGAVSPEAVSLKNSYYGKYVNGFWNSLFGKSGVRLPSDEGTEANVSPIFAGNGDMYYFTDFTSPKEGVDSMLGYSITNARTGEATFYTGNQQKSYMDSAGALQIIEKKFIEKQWQGKMPILYNFYGEASWLTPVLDLNGFLQNYFIISAANPEISVYADTPNQALKKYKTALQRGGTSVDGTSKAEEKQLAGTVLRVYKENNEDQTIVSFLLNNRQNYMISSQTEPLAIYLREGDEVQLTYLETGEAFLPVKELVIVGLE